jgi:hypothetical protein
MEAGAAMTEAAKAETRKKILDFIAMNEMRKTNEKLIGKRRSD